MKIMKKKLFKILSLILVISLCLSSCYLLSSPRSENNATNITIGNQEDPARFDPDEQMRFDEFLKRDFVDSVTSDAVTLHMKIRNPEDYGITDFEVSWGDMLESSLPEEYITKVRDSIEEFRTFDRTKLNKEGQESHDLYNYDAGLFETWLDFYYYDIAFQGDNGIHIIVPILLSEYNFWRKQDIDNYLILCSQIGQMFDAQIEFEKMKAEKKLFMSDRMVDYVIQSCNDFIAKTEDNILILSFKERIDDTDFLSDSEKAEYISKNKEIFEKVIITAYKTLITEMEQLKGSGINDKGLSHYKNGKKYYKFELNRMGITRTPEELIKICDNQMEALMKELFALLTDNPDVFDMLEQPIAPELSPEELIEFLRKETEEDFPALPRGVEYTVKVVDDSLKGFAPAFYISPQLDYFKNNSIYYDSDYADSVDEMYFLMAHEGIPGHMLQAVDLYSGQLPDFRKLYHSKAYTEGWAQYVEFYSYKYLGEENPLVKIIKLDRELGVILSFRLDLGINYEGWSLEKMVKYMKKSPLYDLPYDVCEEIYYDTIKNPIEIAPYVTGRYEIEFMKELYQSELGSAYSEIAFHEELLKRGPAPLFLVQSWMKQEMRNQGEPLKEAA